jgi:predicted anti-sigma-YlaC factor YlaD
MDTMTNHTTPTAHHDYTDLMSLALDGLLSAEEQQRLDQHLAGCLTCRLTWSRWQRIARVLTVQPFVGPPPAFMLHVDRALQRREQRHERLLAGWLLAGGAFTVWTLIALSAALTGAVLLTALPALRVQVVETLGYAGQFIALIFQNLAALRDALALLLPSPLILLVVALALLLAGVAWVRLVFYSAAARPR